MLKVIKQKGGYSHTPKLGAAPKGGGYTIIETMISVAIFLVIIEFGMGSLLGANSLHRKSKDMRGVMDSLSFIMDDISRNLRTGSNYQCFSKTSGVIPTPSTLDDPKSCQDGLGLAFESDAGDHNNTFNDQVVYYIGGGKIWKSTDGAQNFFALTPEYADGTAKVVIDTVSGFSVLGAESPGDTSNRQQPFVTIRFAGTITSKNITTPFSLQTSVSQRLVDI